MQERVLAHIEGECPGAVVEELARADDRSRAVDGDLLRVRTDARAQRAAHHEPARARTFAFAREQRASGQPPHAQVVPLTATPASRASSGEPRTSRSGMLVSGSDSPAAGRRWAGRTGRMPGRTAMRRSTLRSRSEMAARIRLITANAPRPEIAAEHLEAGARDEIALDVLEHDDIRHARLAVEQPDLSDDGAAAEEGELLGASTGHARDDAHTSVLHEVHAVGELTLAAQHRSGGGLEGARPVARHSAPMRPAPRTAESREELVERLRALVRLARRGPAPTSRSATSSPLRKACSWTKGSRR